MPAADKSDVTGTVDPLGVEVGYALVGVVDEKQGGTFLTRVRSIRRQIAAETGMVVPPVHVADNLQLGPRTYTILVKGVEVARGELLTDRLLAINPGTVQRTIEGVNTREPARSAGSGSRRRSATRRRPPATPSSIRQRRSPHTRRGIRTFLPSCGRVSRRRTSSIRSGRRRQLVEELAPKVVSTGDVQRVPGSCCESAPSTTLEARPTRRRSGGSRIARKTRAARSAGVAARTERSRRLKVISLTPVAERWRRHPRTDRGVLAPDPARAQRPASGWARCSPPETWHNLSPSGSPTLRPHLWRLFSRALPHVALVSHGGATWYS
jgi:flagellar biosynthesis protein FlhA